MTKSMRDILSPASINRVAIQVISFSGTHALRFRKYPSYLDSPNM
ncbi:hypothetical protein U0070_026851 [Myodes glareolus]|uniref:Uncharacterized protein n=1 Tax=Myodes glareolus TaxID=447135 RepID=A0AAW0K091_MYOGA